MGDFLGVVLTVLLLAANAFFVGAEFALISARRDRLEALAEQGKQQRGDRHPGGRESAADAGRGAARHHDLFDPAGQGRRTRGGAPAGEAVRMLFGIPDAVLHTVSFVIALTIVVVLHVLLGEMVPKNIAIAGPGVGGDAAGAAVSAVGARRAARHRVLQLVCARDPARVRCRGEDRTGERGFDRRVVGDDRRVAVGGAAGPRGAQPVVPGAADPQPRGGRCRGAARRGACGAGGRRRVRADGGGDPARTGRDRLLPLPRRRPVRRFIGYLHIKDVLPLVDDPEAVLDSSMVRPLPQVPASLPLPDALSRLRRDNSHLALVTDADGRVSRWWRWRTWSKTWSAPFVTGRTVAESVLDEPDWLERERIHQQTGGRFCGPIARAGRRGPPGVGLPVHLLQPAAAAAADLAPRFRRDARRRGRSATSAAAVTGAGATV